MSRPFFSKTLQEFAGWKSPFQPVPQREEKLNNWNKSTLQTQCTNKVLLSVTRPHTLIDKHTHSLACPTIQLSERQMIPVTLRDDAFQFNSPLS